MVDLVTTYGGVADAQFYTTAVLTMAAGSTHLFCSTGIWAGGDANKQIRVGGAGTAALVLESKINTVTSSTHLVLNNAAGTGLSAVSQYVAWGTDNSTAILAFNSASAGSSGVVLTATGKFLVSINGGGGVTLGAGVTSMTLAGAGTTSSYLIGNVAYGATVGIQPYGDASARVQTVAIGASTATLMTVADSSRFSVIPCWCVLTSVDLQGPASDPPNPAFWDYLQVTAVNTTSGLVTFDRAVTHLHKSTYPLYDPGLGTRAATTAPHSSAKGGPATLYILDPTWNIQASFQDVTIVTDPGIGQNSNGRDMEFVRCAGPYTGPVPSINMRWAMTNGNFPAYSMEVDKQIDAFTLSSCTLPTVFMQSASPKLCTLTNSTVASFQGGGIDTITSGNTFSTGITVGVAGFGASNSWNATGDNIASIIWGGVQDINDVTIYTLANGIVSYPLSSDPIRWAVPGAWVFFKGGENNEGFPFIVQDIGTDGNAVYDSLTIASGSTSLSSATGLWAVGDVGKPIKVSNAGAGGVTPLITTIDSYTNSSHISLATAALSALVAATTYVCWGSTQVHISKIASTWPNLTKTGGGLLGLQSAPVNTATFTNCTGCLDAVDLSQTLAANSPLYSYSKRTYTTASWGTGTTGVQPSFNFWGAFTQININVATAYSGAQASCVLTALARGIMVQPTTGLPTVTWPITINMKVAGLRTITATGVTGTASGDNIPGMSYAWFATGAAPYLETNINADSTATWPNVTIEMKSDQGMNLGGFGLIGLRLGR